MYTLYYAPGSASLAIHWMLIELGVPFDLTLVDFAANEQNSQEYLKLNPLGKVPTLIVDGRPCTEATALLMLLAERHPEAGFAPEPGTPQRAAFLETMVYLANTMMPAFRAWFYPQDFGGPDEGERVRSNAEQRIEAHFDRLDGRLSDGGPFLLGDTIAAADFLAIMLCRWSRNMPRPATSWPHLGKYVSRMKQRDGLREVHRRERLTDWIEVEAA